MVVLQGGSVHFSCHRKKRPSVAGGFAKSLGPSASVLDQELMEGIGGISQNAWQFLKHPSLRHCFTQMTLQMSLLSLFKCRDPQSTAPAHHSEADNTRHQRLIEHSQHSPADVE